VFCRRPLIIKAEGGNKLVMKFDKWMRLETVVAMVLPCNVIAAAVSLMMIIKFVELITHVEWIENMKQIKCNCYR